MTCAPRFDAAEIAAEHTAAPYIEAIGRVVTEISERDHGRTCSFDADRRIDDCVVLVCAHPRRMARCFCCRCFTLTAKNAELCLICSIAGLFSLFCSCCYKLERLRVLFGMHVKKFDASSSSCRTLENKNRLALSTIISCLLRCWRRQANILSSK